MAKTIKINPDDIDRVKQLLSKLSGKQAAIAMTRSINRALAGIITDTAQEVVKDLNVLNRDAKATLEAKKASYSNLKGRVVSTGKPINAIDPESKKLRFKGKYKGPIDNPSQGTFKFIFKKSKGERTFPGKNYGHAFRMVTKSGHHGLFVRVKSASGGKRSMGLKEIWTSRVPDIIENKTTSKKITEKAAFRLVKRLESQVDLLLKG